MKRQQNHKGAACLTWVCGVFKHTFIDLTWVFFKIFPIFFWNIGHPVLDKGTSDITFTDTATAAEMFPNAHDYLSNCIENPIQYN